MRGFSQMSPAEQRAEESDLFARGRQVVHDWGNSRAVIQSAEFSDMKKAPGRGGGAPCSGWRWAGLGLGGAGFEAVAAFGGFFEEGEFFSGAAEPDMDVLRGFADFIGDLADGGSGFVGGVEDFGDFLFDKAFGRAGCRGLAPGGFAAAAFGFGAEHANGGAGFAGGEGGDLFFDFSDFGEERLFFLGEGKKSGQGSCVDICKFHKAFLSVRNG